MARSFLERYGSPAPDRGMPAGCLPLALALLIVPGVGLLRGPAGMLRWLGAPLLFVAAVLIGFWLYGRLLLAIASLGGLGPGKRGVLIYSDSPHWKAYVEERWLPRFGERFALLNWSERSRWRETLAVRIWRHYCGHYRGFGRYTNFNPAVIVLRGLRRPLVFRFYVWFQANRYDQPEGLRDLESQLFAVLENP